MMFIFYHSRAELRSDSLKIVSSFRARLQPEAV